MPHSDPEARRRYHQEWKARNRGRYARRQKATDAARHANERAFAYGASGRISIDDAERVLSVEQCQYCSTTDPAPWWSLDHVVPLHSGGENVLSNLVCSCTPCNISKFRSNDVVVEDQAWMNLVPRWSGLMEKGWSRNHDCCVCCGTDARPHLARGMCGACYHRDRRRKNQDPA